MGTFGSSSTWSRARSNNRTPEELRLLLTIMSLIPPLSNSPPLDGGRIKEGDIALALAI